MEPALQLNGLFKLSWKRDEASIQLISTRAALLGQPAAAHRKPVRRCNAAPCLPSTHLANHDWIVCMARVLVAGAVHRKDELSQQAAAARARALDEHRLGWDRRRSRIIELLGRMVAALARRAWRPRGGSGAARAQRGAAQGRCVG